MRNSHREFKRSAPEPLEKREMLTTLPAGFAEFQITDRLSSAPVTLLQTPDDRLIISTDDNDSKGEIFVVKNGQILNRPAVQLSIQSQGEHGMIGMVLDPNFASNNYLYLMYTTNQGGLHNRVSRFTFNGDTINPNTERVLLDLDGLDDGTVHNGGGMAFGNDGKLYIGVGDNQVAENAEKLTTVLGKILRINSDGSIPTDNPFYNRTSGINRAIYATGVRNPFTMDADPESNRIYFNDVGPASFEEINEIKRGADYGWPSQGAGPGSDNGFEDPVHAYRHSGDPGGCAITGGRFNRSTNSQFPAAHDNKYYFTDYCGGWVYTYDPQSGNVDEFATDLSVRPVSPYIDDDGSIYYLSREERAVFKIEYLSSNDLQITQQPQDTQVVLGQTATFSVRAVPDNNGLSYQWQRQPSGGSYSNIGGANGRVLTINNPRNDDDGARYRVIVSDGPASVRSQPATLEVTNGGAPSATINRPNTNETYVAGDTINYAGFATDPDESGNLPASSLSWEVTFQHDDHDHPVLGPITGVNGGSFEVPRSGETSANTWFRIHLTATDDSGLETYTFHDIFPEKSTFTLDSNIDGIELLLDGTPVDTPSGTLGVIGVRRSIGLASPQVVGGREYEFVEWAHGGGQSQTISTPTSDRTYTAVFAATDGGGGNQDGGDQGGGNTDNGGGPNGDGLATQFKLDEGSGTAADSAAGGVSDTAFLRDGAAWTNDGLSNAAVRFDGDEAHLSVPRSTDINDRDARQLTVGFWFKADNVNDAGKQLLYKQQNSKRGLNAYLENGRLYVGGWNDRANWSGTFLSTDQVNSGTWHHVAIVLDAGTSVTSNAFRGYIDGVPFGSGVGAAIPAQGGATSFGARDGSTRFHSGNSDADRVGFAGIIDEFVFYHRPLSAAEIQSLASGSGGGNTGGGDTGGGNTGGGNTGGGDTGGGNTGGGDTGGGNTGGGGDTGHDHGSHNHDVVIDGVITHFQFEEGTGTSVSDSATDGTADTGLLVNGAQWSTDGVIGGSLRLDGVDDYLSVPDSTDFNDRYVEETTIAFWFRAEDLGRDTKQLLYKQNGHSRGLNIYLQDGRLFVGGWNDVLNWPGTFLSTSDSLEPNAWHHVALVIDATETMTANGIRGYLNGSEFGSGSATQINRHLGNVSFGRIDQATRFHDTVRSSFGVDQGAPFAGWLDDVRVFDRALSNAEISSLANGDDQGNSGGGSGGGGHSHDLFEEAASPTPTLSIDLQPTRTIGVFNLSVDLSNFTLNPNGVDGPSEPNEGHMHLLIDGARVDRFFDLQRQIEVPEGQHLVQVELSTNDHRPWAVNGEPIRDGENVTVQADNDGGGGNGNSSGNVAGAISLLAFDEGSGVSSNDQATTGVHDVATLINGVTWASGVSGSAVRFDGENDFVVIADSTDFNGSTLTQHTVSFWFQADDVDLEATQLLFKQSGRQRGINAYLHDGRLFVGGWSDKIGWSGTFLSTDAIQSSTWHHVTLVLDGGEQLQPNRFHGYLDGVRFGSGEGGEISRHLGDISLGALLQATRFHLGDSKDVDPVASFAGSIDELRVFDRTLSPGEIQTLAGVAVQPIPPMPADRFFARPGDVNLDDRVDFADFLALAANFGNGQTDSVWEDGDFDESGTVDFSDFLALAANFSK